MPFTLFEELRDTIQNDIFDYNYWESLLFKKDEINPFALSTEASHLPFEKKLKINQKMLEKLKLLDKKVEIWLKENAIKSPYTERMGELATDIQDNFKVVNARLQMLEKNKNLSNSADIDISRAK